MSDKLLETKFLFDKIRKIYPTFQIPDELDIDCWEEILRGYSQDDILKALKAYRKTVEYNTAPTPATFSKFLHEENGAPKYETTTEPSDPSDWHTFWNIDPALAYYMRDCETKDKVHGLIFYRWALRDIISEMVDTLPNADKMNYGNKIDIIRRNGWDSDIYDRVDRIVSKALDRPVQPDIDGFKNLGSAWRV